MTQSLCMMEKDKKWKYKIFTSQIKNPHKLGKLQNVN